MFFKFNKEVSTGNLKLSEYDKIWTKFCFLDETGTLSGTLGEIFSVGILKMSQPYYLQSKLYYERSRLRFYDEIKFNKLSKNNLPFAKIALDSLFSTKSISFYSYSISTKSSYFLKHFDKNPWLAYEQITLKLLDAALANQEIIMLMADYVTTPKNIKFEVNTKKNFNKMKNRLALAGVCRFDSKSNDLLQLVDLLIGAITYEVKYQKKLVPGSKFKLEFVEYLKSKLDTKTLTVGYRKNNFNIFVDRSDQAQEKGLSS